VNSVEETEAASKTVRLGVPRSGGCKELESPNRNISQISVSDNPTLAQKRTVSTNDILADLKAGLFDNALEQKYQIKEDDLKNIFGKLISPQFIAEEDLRGRNNLVKEQAISIPQGNIDKNVSTAVVPTKEIRLFLAPLKKYSRTDISTTPPFRWSQTGVRTPSGKFLMKSETSPVGRTEARPPS
jgi:hypothetical protein